MHTHEDTSTTPPTRILLKISEAAAAIAVSRRTLYNLLATNPEFRAAVVKIPNVRGMYIHAGRLRQAIERMAPVEEVR